MLFRSGAPFGTTVPPAPTTGSKKWIGIVVAVVALVGIVAFATRDKWLGGGTITVNYTLEVVSDSYCSDFANTGYDDIPYADAELYDGSGTVLGFGALDGGVDTDTSCVFSATFTADESSDGTYRITAGNSNRGFLNYDDSDVIDGVLSIDAIID